MASNKTSGLPLLIVLLSLGGCSSGDDATPEVQAQKPSLFKDQTQALDRAKEVEKTLLENAQRQRQEIERQSQ